MMGPSERLLNLARVLSDSPLERAEHIVQREDDTKSVYSTRLKKFNEENDAMIKFYEEKGLLVRVDGVGTPEEVSERMMAALKKA